MNRTPLLVAATLAAGMGLGVLATRPATVAAQSAGQPAATNNNTYEQLDLFGTVFDRVRAKYVEPVDDAKLIESAINGMLAGLDPHSSYMNAKDYADMQVQTKGEFGGLGIEVTMEQGLIKVITPMDDSPAVKAGIKPGDFISFIDGDAVMGLTLDQAIDKMRGDVGTGITVTIVRGSEEPFDVTLKRAVIQLKSVRWELQPGNIGYVRISSFSDKTDSGLRDALTKLDAATKNQMIGLVLDLRNNPGGLLDQAIEVSDDFLEKGEIVSTRGRNPEEGQRWNAESGDLMKGKPIVVLINGGSASASEIVAGALQDHHRAILMGTKSFGKGSVQSVMPIPNHGAIRLTTARYYTPSGRSIQGLGVDPDIAVEQANIESIAEQSRHEADLRGALENKGGTAPKDGDEESQPQSQATPEKTPENPPANQGGTAPEGQPMPDDSDAIDQPKKDETKKPERTFVGSEHEPITEPTKDYQLARALDLLKGLSLVQSNN